ncbi:DUF3888 domain-containing protein [Bacillus sp. SD075]|uniref:DUF3888 domain-containing protein n=1 Tax=Bacillus sp. SD075 TaxID=2781732 RepID=UPI001A96EFB5|nr:DUF3888 domain-containing protein [Bacillus sp. SD075]MBO0997466.1 DUF3888 domain-containing protein [Bacillus sp. SD075]
MAKRYLILLGFFLLAYTPMQAVKAESVSKVEGWYGTTEDIFGDIVFPTLDKKIEKEYGRNLGWQWQRIVGINYNENHSYDVDIKIQVTSERNEPLNYVDDQVKLRIFPSCDSEKLNQLKCNHGFKIEILDYKHLSQ